MTKLKLGQNSNCDNLSNNSSQYFNEIYSGQSFAILCCFQKVTTEGEVQEDRSHDE